MIDDALSSAAFTARPPRRPIWEREAAADRVAPADPALAAAPAPDLRSDFDGSFAGWHRATFSVAPVTDPPPAA